MMPASNKGVGMSLSFPDILLTMPPVPPVPIPWPNLAMNAMAVPFSPNIFVGFVPALTMASVVPLTLGDQGGLASGHIMGPGMVTMGNPTIFINCVPAANLLVPTTGNAMNAFVGAAVVPSVSTTFFTDREAERVAAPGLAPDVLAWLEDEVAPSDAATTLRTQGDVLVATIARVTRTTASRVLSALDGTRPSGLVLDLRGCPGGDLRAALELVDELVPRGSTLCVRLDAGDDIATGTRLIARRGATFEGRVAVLVDRATASAAELVAAVLAHHERALVLGERTAGKGTVQTLVADGEGGRYATVAELRLPDGAAIHGEGVTPHRPLVGGIDEAIAALAPG